MYSVEESFRTYLRDIGAKILFSPAPGETIKETRRSLETSQEEMARLLGIRRETLSRIETGSISPTATFIRRFSRFASAIKVFRDLNALRDAGRAWKMPMGSSFLRAHFSLTPQELDELMRIGNKGYSKTKKKVLRRMRI